MKKAVKIGIGASVVGVTGLSIFAILRQRKLAKQAFDAAEFSGDDENEIMMENDVDEAEAEAAEEEQDSGDEAEAAELSDDADDSLDAEIEADNDEIMVENDVDDEVVSNFTINAEEDDDNMSVESDVDTEQMDEQLVLIFESVMRKRAPDIKDVWSYITHDEHEAEKAEKMKSLSYDDWDEIEEEIVKEASGVDEKYIRWTFMKKVLKEYNSVTDEIDSVIDYIFANDKSKYIMDGHTLNSMILIDVVLECAKRGITVWMPHLVIYIGENVNSRCEYIEAVLAKEQPQ